MTDNSTSESSPPAERAISLPAIIAAIFLGLHILPLFWPSIPMWGVDFLVYLPAPAQGAFILLSILLFVPGFRRKVRAWVSCLPLAIWGRGRRVWISRGPVILTALVAFIAFSSTRHFLGDGYHVLEKLDAEDWHDVYRAPFTYAIIGTLHRLGGVLWETVENSYRAYSYVSGIIYVLFSFPVAAASGKNALERTVVLAFLLTAGFIQQFFGYVENYALYLPGLLLYLFLGLRTLDHRIPVFVPALLLGILLALHRVLAIFGPSLLYLAYRDYRRRSNRFSTGKSLLATAAAIGCVPASAAVFLALSGVGFEAYVDRTGGGEFLPLLDQPGYYAQYRIFSLEHLVDFINLQLISAPAACMAIFIGRKRPLSRHAFLAICTAIPLFFTFIAKANLGAFRDWDILSLPALPLTLWAATMLLERIRDGEKLFHCAFLICGAAALHTLSWIGVNAGPETAEARFTNQLGRLTGHARTSGWVTMGKFHRQQENPSAALVAYKRALDADPTNPNRWITVGGLHRELGQSKDAIEHFRKAAELRPGIPIPYMNLGAAYSDMGEFGKAIEYTRKAITLKPDLATAHANLGAIYRKTGQFDKAVEHLDKASDLQPRDADTFSNLGAAYNDAGQHAKAIRALEKAAALRPDDAVAYGNLGAVFSRIGQFDSGVQHLQRALELQPDYIQAHKNLGLVYKTRGRYQEAIGHFKKVLELQRESVSMTVYLDIGDTHFKLSEHDKAIPYFKRAIQLNPNHANAHLLLGLSYRALKREDLASVHFQKTLELEPNHPQAAQIKRWLERANEEG